jgi:LmbE family N-acetylglucosaminyl deacetylase
MNFARQKDYMDSTGFYPSDMFDTPLPLWSDVPQLQSVVTIDCDALVAPRQRAVIVATHADDDVLGFGGLLQLLRAERRQVTIIYVTGDGIDHADADDVVHAGIEARRRLALPPQGIRCLHGDFPVGAIDRHVARLTRFLALHLRAGDAVFTTWQDDGHPDHEAVARAVAAAASERNARVHEMPLWAWQWATPASLPWERACLLWLDPETHQRKRDAIEALRTFLQLKDLQTKDAHAKHPQSKNSASDHSEKDDSGTAVSGNNQPHTGVGRDITALFNESVLERLQQPFELIFL